MNDLADLTRQRGEMVERTIQWLERKHFYPLIDIPQIADRQALAAYIQRLETEVMVLREREEM